jgi:hypothetical protein
LFACSSAAELTSSVSSSSISAFSSIPSACLDHFEKTRTLHLTGTSASAHFAYRSIASDDIEAVSRANSGCHHINISADVGRASQRCGFIEQPINSGLFELPLSFALFAPLVMTYPG